MKVCRCVWEGGEWGSNWQIDLPRKKLPSKNPALLELHPIQLETFEKILLKLGPSNIALICRVYETRFITRKPEMSKVVDTQRLTKISKKNDFSYFDPPGIKI